MSVYVLPPHRRAVGMCEIAAFAISTFPCAPLADFFSPLPDREKSGHAGGPPWPCPVRQEYFPLYSPNFTRHEFSRESSSYRSLNRSLSYRKSTLTNKAPIRLSHALGARNHIAVDTSTTAVGRVK